MSLRLSESMRYSRIEAAIKNFAHTYCTYTYIYNIYIYIFIYGVFSKFLYPYSDEKHVHCVFTGLRLESSSTPTNLQYDKNKL